MNKQSKLFPEAKAKNNLSINFNITDNKIRKVTTAGKFSGVQELALDGTKIEQKTESHIWSLVELNQRMSPRSLPDNPASFNVVDLFCGTGGFSLGVKRGLRSLGLEAQTLFANDLSKDAEEVYSFNHRPKEFIRENALNLLNSTHNLTLEGLKMPSVEETTLIPELENIKGKVDILLAGPPCEGNSNLNNITRRIDPRNELYVLSVLIGIVLGAKIILIENVPAVRSARQKVVERSKLLLSQNGYDIKDSEFLLSANDHLVAQTRRRHFLIAVKSEFATEKVDLTSVCFPPMDVSSILKSSKDYNKGHLTLDYASEVSPANEKRIKYLYKTDEYDLPDKHRPDCHKLKDHSYPSVYGRMYPDKPAPTLSTGFLSPGRGRFIHPFEPRTLTCREGARLQGFPLYYNWYPPGSNLGKTNISRLIGDAVPPNLGMIALLIGMSKL